MEAVRSRFKKKKKEKSNVTQNLLFHSVTTNNSNWSLVLSAIFMPPTVLTLNIVTPNKFTSKS